MKTLSNRGKARTAAFAAAALLVAAATAIVGARQISARQDPTPLKEAYKGKFLIGTALNYPALQDQAPNDVEIAQKYFSAITPGNSLKPDFTQHEEGIFTFDQGDRLVQIAEQAGAVPI